MPRKSTVLFLLIVTAVFLFMTYQSRKGRSATETLLASIMNSAHKAVESVSDSMASPFRKIALRDEDNRKLRKQLDAILLERAEFQEEAAENERLRKLLSLRERTPNAVAAAEVIARGPNLWSQSLVLSKGQRDGIMKDMTAMTPQGLAGKITAVSEGFSNLLLVTDISFSAAVRLQESRKEGIISGTGARRLALKYIPYEEEVKPGDIIVTSGLDRLFPPGIPVGFVARVDREGKGHFQFIEVTPFADTGRIEEVMIVR